MFSTDGEMYEKHSAARVRLSLFELRLNNEPVTDLASHSAGELICYDKSSKITLIMGLESASVTRSRSPKCHDRKKPLSSFEQKNST